MTHGSTPISDEYMSEMLGKTRAYTLVLLKAGPGYGAGTRARPFGSTGGATSRCAPRECSPSWAR